MREKQIFMRENRSIKIPGPVIYIDENGEETLIEDEWISICRCGGSKKQPFCDDSHRENGFKAPPATFKFIHVSHKDEDY